MLTTERVTERVTVDGHPVKVGDIAWRSDRNLAAVGKFRIYKHHLGMWWSWLSEEIYSTERAATRAAIDRQRQALMKAKREVRRATKAIDRLASRLAACASEAP